jgi:mannose-6-phosphate isomerase-like protein (cupin superfamily)
MRRRRALLGALVLSAPLIAAPTAPFTPTLDALIGATRAHFPLSTLADRAPLAPDQDFRVVEIGRDASTSHHIVVIRKAETPHRHDQHDLFVMIVRGRGSMRIGEEELPVDEGSLIYVPRGAVHAFANRSPSPAVAYVVYSPPFDDSDRVEAR